MTTYRCDGCVDIERMKSTVPEEEQGIYVLLVPADQVDEDEDDDYREE